MKILSVGITALMSFGSISFGSEIDDLKKIAAIQLAKIQQLENKLKQLETKPPLVFHLVSDGWSNNNPDKKCEALDMKDDCYGHGCGNCFPIMPRTFLDDPYGIIYRDKDCTNQVPLYGTGGLSDCKFGNVSTHTGGGCPGGEFSQQKQHIYYGNSIRFVIACFNNIQK